ncbi:uncharacterized protein LOC123525873 [Mercenaria mercenaria]|uniref:uncharacterized protein LOC123525873 n=1 Tax=Mercenaria mercenaria TaxID=6596 RepID=UPI00234E3D70|nr:uncharacterized protein LOC123525873 [Mercenaria mercenaria]
METDTDIAVIGIGCRFPGADNIDEFWRVLVNGENHVVDIPPERWNNAAFYSDNPDEPGKYYGKKAGFLNRHDEWDNSLFGISDTEAVRIDPQHRYVLECTHMAMEDGGITRKHISGTKTGVYIGAMNDDYKSLSNLDHDEDTNYTATGMSTTIIASRVSYVYNLRGPCMVVDTACSSSITAINLASEAIRSGDCDMAICGGVNSLLCPDVFITLSRAKILSQTGQCQTFCDSADGYARAEGCGIVIIKSLKKALQDKNKIWGVVRTGINQDGRSVQPITTPSGEQHEELFKQVYSRYDVNPTDLQYIEAHGTGTRVGDPTEVNALGRFISKYRNESKIANLKKDDDDDDDDADEINSPGQKGIVFKKRLNKEIKQNSHGTDNNADPYKEREKILIGSVKTNIGHAEAAAGMSGLIKVLLMMKNGSYVPSIHIRRDKSNLNKNIKLEEYGFDIAMETDEWRTNELGERICCVNSFGFGGSNSHAIVIQIPEHRSKSPNTTESNLWFPVCVSAPKTDCLKSVLESLSTHLDTKICNLQDVSFTSVFHRDHYSSRTLLFGTSKEEITQQLRLKLSNMDQIQTQQKFRTIFVFCGVGTTWSGMCREMTATQPVFKEKLMNIDQHLKLIAGWSIVARIEAQDYSDPVVNHIAIFCTQVALYELWKSWGIYADAIVGQSVGEVAAAYASGALCLQDAVSVIYYRSKELAENLGGVMVVVGNIPIQDVVKMCDQYARRVTIAVYNSPYSCTLSGDADVMDKIVDQIEVLNRECSSNILIKRLSVPCAYHSHYVEASMVRIRSHLKAIRKGTREIDHYSTVTGQLATADEFQTGQYWADNVYKPVRFMEAIEAAAQKDVTNVYVEVGPRPVLKAHLKNILGDKFRAVSLPSMNMEKENMTAFSSLGLLYELGADIKWENLNISGTSIDVPRYTFSKSKLLFIPFQKQQVMRGVPTSNYMHMYVRDTGSQRETFQIKLDRETTPFVFDHYFLNSLIVPGAIFVEAAFDIGQKKTELSVYELSISSEFCHRLSLENDEQLLVEAEVTSGTDRNGYHYVFKDKRETICQGHIFPRTNHTRSEIDLAPIISRCKVYRNNVESYKCLGQLGLRYGESLALIQQSWTSSKECIAEILVPKTVQKQIKMTHFHPSIIDALFQAFGILHVTTTEIEGITLPKAFRSLVIYMPPQERMYAYCQRIEETPLTKHYNLLLLSTTGITIAEIKGFYPNTTKAPGTLDDSIVYNLRWKKIRVPDKIERPGNDNTNGLLVFASKHFIDNFNSPGDTLVSGKVILDNTIDDASVFRKALMSVSTTSRIIFAPFHHIANTSSDNMEVFLRSKTNFQNLALLIQVLKEANTSVPVFVVTEGVMADPDLKISSSNICGAELWGLVRSVLREHSFIDVRLVDMTISDINFTVLYDVLWSDNVDFHEYLIHNGKLFHSDLVDVLNTVPSKRRITFDPAETMIVKSDCPSIVTNVHLEHKHKETDMLKAESQQNRQNYRDILVHFVCIHNTDLYPISTVLDSSGSSIWPESNEFGFPVLCLEGVGTMVDRSFKSEPHMSKPKVGFCFPTDVTTTVSVPSNCTFDVAEPSIYVPGMMTLGVIVWSIADICNTSSSICVILDEELQFCTDAITEIFKRQGKIVQIDDMKSLSEKCSVQAVAPRTLVILGKIVDHNACADIIPVRYPNVISIISIEAYFPRAVERATKHQYKSLSIHVLKAEDFFTSSRLTKIVPELNKMFRSSTLSMTIEQIACLSNHDSKAHEVLKLPFPILLVTDEKLLECKIPVMVTKEELFRRNGCYILIAGLTGLGWDLLQLIAELGAGCVATISRKVPSSQKKQDIEDVQNRYSCKVISLQADISDIRQLEDALKELQVQIDGDFQIRGVFHGGAVTRDMLLEDMSEEDVEKPLFPKILGTWNLHLATRHMALDFFVMHSSIVSIFGNKGQCNYAAGNAFQDAVAHYRRSLGLCGQSINWSTLAVGMAIENKKLEGYLKSQGFHFLSSADIRKCFIRALMENYPQVIFGRFDWKSLQENGSIQFNSAKFASFAKVEIQSTKHSGLRDNQFCFEEYYESSAEKQREIIECLVKLTISEMLVIDNFTLTKHSSFTAMGIDSMTAASFINSIVKATRVRVPLDQIYNDSTVETVTKYIVEHIPHNTKSPENSNHTRNINWQEQSGSLTTRSNPDNETANTPAKGVQIDSEITTKATIDSDLMMAGERKLRSHTSENIFSDYFVIQNNIFDKNVHVSLTRDNGSLLLQWYGKARKLQVLHVKLVMEIDLKNVQGDFHILLKCSDEWIGLITSSENTATRWFKVLKEAIDRNVLSETPEESATSV